MSKWLSHRQWSLRAGVPQELPILSELRQWGCLPDLCLWIRLKCQHDLCALLVNLPDMRFAGPWQLPQLREWILPELRTEVPGMLSAFLF